MTSSISFFLRIRSFSLWPFVQSLMAHFARRFSFFPFRVMYRDLSKHLCILDCDCDLFPHGSHRFAFASHRTGQHRIRRQGGRQNFRLRPCQRYDADNLCISTIFFVRAPTFQQHCSSFKEFPKTGALADDTYKMSGKTGSLRYMAPGKDHKHYFALLRYLRCCL